MDKLMQDGDRKVCVSCYMFNCWHGRKKPCDVEGCQCTLGGEEEEEYATA